jgi:hypothetical protein
MALAANLLVVSLANLFDQNRDLWRTTMISKLIMLAALMILHTYEARIRLDGRVSTTQVKASDAGQAKKLVQSQFPKATVLSVKKVD